MSQSSASANPPASAGPLTAATTGLRAPPHGLKGVRCWSRRAAGGCSRSPPNCVVSMPAQKAVPGARSARRSRPSRRREPLERVGQLDPQVDRERVPLLRPLERDDRDVVVLLYRQQCRARRAGYRGRRCGDPGGRPTG